MDSLYCIIWYYICIQSDLCGRIKGNLSALYSIILQSALWAIHNFHKALYSTKVFHAALNHELKHEHKTAG